MASHVANVEPSADTLRHAVEDNVEEKVHSQESSFQDQTPSESAQKSGEDEGKGGLNAYFVSSSGTGLSAMD